MEFLDVVFPVNIGALTYRCPETLSARVKPGMIVSAPLRNRITKGIVLGKPPGSLPGEMKYIYELHGDAAILSEKMIDLLKWMSEYYVADQGLVLKNILPKEAFTKVKRGKAKIPPSLPVPCNRKVSGVILKRGWPDGVINGIHLGNDMATGIIDSIKSGAYKTFLLHAPSSSFEYTFLIKVLAETKNAILLVPEISVINSLYPVLNEKFGERICLFHSDLSRGERSEAIERILSGRSDIVLGTRSAVFAPMKQVSFIAVIGEHSSSYKQESRPCYSGRDVAVMRGYLERAVVLLSSISPSIDSFFNCKAGKYKLLRPPDDIKKPRIRLIDMKYEKRVKPYLSKKVIDAAVNYLKNNKKVMFVANRRGYSTLLRCGDCTYIEECPHCRIPLIFHKQDMSLKCHYCGYTLSQVPERCDRCKGFNLKLSGAGVQKVQEDIEELTGIKPLRLDSDRTRKKSELERLIECISADENRILVGTKLMTRRLGVINKFSMAAVLNADLFLSIPDFRSAEKAYQEILSVADRIQPDGEIFIQTWMPQEYLYKCLKNYNYDSFFKEELGRRKSLAYPPYSRLLLMKFISKRDISSELSEIIRKSQLIETQERTVIIRTNPPAPHSEKGRPGRIFRKGEGDLHVKRTAHEMEILGPYISTLREGKNEYRLLLKSSMREKLHVTAKYLIEAFKDSKDLEIRVDVDPMVI